MGANEFDHIYEIGIFVFHKYSKDLTSFFRRMEYVVRANETVYITHDLYGTSGPQIKF